MASEKGDKPGSRGGWPGVPGPHRLAEGQLWEAGTGSLLGALLSQRGHPHPNFCPPAVCATPQRVQARAVTPILAPQRAGAWGRGAAGWELLGEPQQVDSFLRRPEAVTFSFWRLGTRLPFLLMDSQGLLRAAHSFL